MFEANRHLNRWPLRALVRQEFRPKHMSLNDSAKVIASNLMDCVLIGPDEGDKLRKIVNG